MGREATGSQAARELQQTRGGRGGEGLRKGEAGERQGTKEEGWTTVGSGVGRVMGDPSLDGGHWEQSVGDFMKGQECAP